MQGAAAPTPTATLVRQTFAAHAYQFSGPRIKRIDERIDLTRRRLFYYPLLSSSPSQRRITETNRRLGETHEIRIHPSIILNLSFSPSYRPILEVGL